MTGLMLTERLALTEGKRQSVWGHWLEKAASSNDWSGNCEDICLLWGDSEGEYEFFLCQISGLYFLKPTSWTRAPTSALLDTGDDLEKPPTVTSNFNFSMLFLRLRGAIWIYCFPYSNPISWIYSPHFNIVSNRKFFSTWIFSIKLAALGNTNKHTFGAGGGDCREQNFYIKEHQPDNQQYVQVMQTWSLG